MFVTLYVCIYVVITLNRVRVVFYGISRYGILIKYNVRVENIVWLYNII